MMVVNSIDRADDGAYSAYWRSSERVNDVGTFDETLPPRVCIQVCIDGIRAKLINTFVLHMTLMSANVNPLDICELARTLARFREEWLKVRLLAPPLTLDLAEH